MYAVWLHIFCSSNITSMWSCKDSVATQSTICIYICMCAYILNILLLHMLTLMLGYWFFCPTDCDATCDATVSTEKKTDSCGDKGSYLKGMVITQLTCFRTKNTQKFPTTGRGASDAAAYICVYVCLHGCDTYDGNCTACALYVYTYI